MAANVRPRGLRRSQQAPGGSPPASKRARAADEVAEAEAEAAVAVAAKGAEDDDSGALAQVALPAADGRVLSEVEEAHELVAAALALMDGEADDEDDAEDDDGDRDAARGDKARTLLQGAIHEYDRMLRTAGSDADPYDSEFHRFYGDALRELGRLLRDAAFVQASIDRYETALEKDAHSTTALAATATAHLLLAELATAEDAMLQAVDRAVQGLLRPELVAAVPDAKARGDLLATFAHQLHDFVDARDEDARLPALWVHVEGLFKKALEADPASHSALAGSGLCSISAVHSLPEDTPADAVVALIDAALAAIKQADALAEQAAEGTAQSRYLTWLAEALMVKMDLVLDDAEANEEHIEGVLRRAAELDPANASYLEEFVHRGD